MKTYSFKPPPDYAVIDVETTEIRDGEIPETLFWGYADSRGYEKFKTTRGLLAFLEKEKETPKILLHHSNFDVIQMLVDGANDVKVLRSHNGRLIRCALWRHTLQNTFTVFPVALKKIFKAFGYTKTDLGQLAKRNWEDCVNGLDCFRKLDDLFQELIGVSPLQCGTVAGTTFRAAETMAGTMPTDLRFLPAYRGGRVEVFNLRKQRASKFDIHSSYPRSFLEAPDKDKLLRVRVKTRDWHCPFFDASREDLLLFPNGTFETWIFESNLEKYILPNCEKTSLQVKAKHAINFAWLRNVRELVEKIYAIKQTTTDAGIALCCKFLLNSFYGRIGLKGESERCRILDYKPDGDDISVYYLGKKRWIAFDTVERENRSNFPFAAFITDNARARLFRAFKRNAPLYGDTDSIFSSNGRASFSESITTKCGDWGYEGKKLFKANNVKDYEWNGETVCKGGHDFTTWTIKRFAAGKSAAATKRTRKTSLRKRIVLPNGETKPIVVNT